MYGMQMYSKNDQVIFTTGGMIERDDYRNDPDF